MTIQDALRALGTAIGISELGLDANGICRLETSDGLAVEVEPSGETAAFFHAITGNSPPDADASFFQALLGANFFCTETGASFLAMDTADGSIAIQRRLDLRGLREEEFVGLFEDFVGDVLLWRDRLATMPATEAEASREPLSHDFIRV